MPARSLDRQARVRNPRVARAATQRRIKRKSRARYFNITRVSLFVGALALLLMLYVMMTSMLTGLSYAVARAEHRRESLQEETMRLEDRITALRSDDRLATIAARLKMVEPANFAVVRLPRPQIALDRPRIAVLSSLAGFFVPAVVRHR